MAVVHKLFNEPVKCARCGKVVPAEAKHVCVPLWVSGLAKGAIKLLVAFLFAWLVGLGVGFGFSHALRVSPVVVSAVVTCGD